MGVCNYLGSIGEVRWHFKASPTRAGKLHWCESYLHQKMIANCYIPYRSKGADCEADGTARKEGTTSKGAKSNPITCTSGEGNHPNTMVDCQVDWHNCWWTSYIPYTIKVYWHTATRWVWWTRKTNLIRRGHCQTRHHPTYYSHNKMEPKNIGHKKVSTCHPLPHGKCHVRWSHWWIV